MTTAITAGTILVSTWGYDQTNVDFYEVVKKTDAWVWIQPIGQMTVAQLGWASEMVQPSGIATGKVIRRKAKTWEGTEYVSIDTFSIAKPYEGKAVLQTSYA